MFIKATDGTQVAYQQLKVSTLSLFQTVLHLSNQGENI